MDKIELLQDYIEKCDNYEMLGISPKELINQITSVFENEIKDIYSGVFLYSFSADLKGEDGSENSIATAYLLSIAVCYNGKRKIAITCKKI